MNYVDDLFFKDESYRIVGLCMKVHNTLGKGFKEVVYQDALEIELERNSIPYEREKKFRIIYDGVELKSKFIADFIVFGSIVLELKAIFQLHCPAFRQTLNYLKASGIKLGLLINFGEERLKFQRIVC